MSRRPAALLPILALWGALAHAAPAAAPAEGTVVTSDGARLAWRSVGRGHEAVVIPLAVWLSPRFDALASRMRVVYYDPRGRGRSDGPAGGRLSMAADVGDLEALRQDLGLERMALVGWSVYGLLVAQYALEHPERITRLVQLMPVPPVKHPYMDERDEAVRARFSKADWDEYTRLAEDKSDPVAACRQFQRALLRGLLADPAGAATLDVEAVCAARNEWPENFGPAIQAYMEGLGDWDLRPRLTGLRAPRLVIHGERDTLPLDGSRAWVAGAHKARLLIAAGADHASMVEQPEPLLRAVRRFLEGGWPEGAVAIDEGRR